MATYYVGRPPEDLANMAPEDAETWLRGALDRHQEIDRVIATWQTRRSEVRDEIGILVAAHFNNRAALPGLGRVELRAPGTARVWDSGALSELAQSLRETGHGEIAAELEACRRTQERAGGLAVKWETAGEEAGASS